jgi:putative hydrolase of the HAD superfamily
MPDAFRSVLFDLDGTLYFSDALGLEISRVANRYFARLKGVSEEQAQELILAVRQRITAETGIEGTLSLACVALGGDLRELHRCFSEQLCPEHLLTRDERVVSLLEALGSRYSLYIYTNNNRSLSNRIMAALGIGGFFIRVFTIEDSWTPKPDRRVLEQIMGEIGQSAGDCLFVGDRYDIDLKIPEEMGAQVRLVSRVEELLALGTFTERGQRP